MEEKPFAIFTQVQIFISINKFSNKIIKITFTVVKPGGALDIDIFGFCWFSDVSGFVVDGKLGKIAYEKIRLDIRTFLSLEEETSLGFHIHAMFAQNVQVYKWRNEMACDNLPVDLRVWVNL